MCGRRLKQWIQAHSDSNLGGLFFDINDRYKEALSVTEFHVGDVVKLKKKHPCGSFEWEILRVGADFRLKCAGCGRQVMMARSLVEKNLKAILK